MIFDLFASAFRMKEPLDSGGIHLNVQSKWSSSSPADLTVDRGKLGMRRPWVGHESDSPVVVPLNAKRAEKYGELTLFTCSRNSENFFFVSISPLSAHAKRAMMPRGRGRGSSEAIHTTNKKPNKSKIKTQCCQKRPVHGAYNLFIHTSYGRICTLYMDIILLSSSLPI